MTKPAAAAKPLETEKPAGDAGDAGRPWPDKATAADPGGRVKPIAESRVWVLENRDPGLWACVERGTPYETVLQPSFWANVAKIKKFTPGQTIHVQNDETTWFAQLKIIECGSNWARCVEWMFQTVAEMEAKHPLPSRDKSASVHRVEWAGAMDKFRIIRTTDQAVIRAGFDSEREANGYLGEYLRRLGT